MRGLGIKRKTAIAAIVLVVGTSVVYAQVGHDLTAAGLNTKDAAVTDATKLADEQRRLTSRAVTR